MKRTVRSEMAELTVRENGLISVRANVGAEINLKEAKEYHSLVKYLCKGKPHSTVLDITGVKYISKEAREFLSTNSSEWGKTVAVALIVNSFMARVIANFFLTVNKPNYPVKTFSDPVLAQQWARNEYYKFTLRVAS